MRTLTLGVVGALIVLQWIVISPTDVLASTGSPPSPWIATDIGDVAQPGHSEFETSGGRLFVTGGGADIWGTADAFQFMYQPLSGDGEIRLSVIDVQNTDPNAKAGIMIRQNLDPGSPHVILDIQPDRSLEFMRRASPGGLTTFIAGGVERPPAVPGLFGYFLLRVTRVGEIVTGAIWNSTNGGWTTIGVTTFTSGPVLIGVAVTSHNPSTLNRATFSGMPQVLTTLPWGNYDVGEVGLAGGASYTDGTFTIRGAGSDIWGTSDSFHYVSQGVEGDIDFIARVVSEEDPNSLAKAGILMSGCGQAAGAAVVLDVLPTGEIEFMSRQPHQSMVYVAGGSASFPVWLKLSRVGNLFTGSISSDGASWQPIGTTDVPMSSRCDIWDYEAGLAVTSHDPSVLNTAVFDRVALNSPPFLADIVVRASDIPENNLHGNWRAVPSATSPNQIMLATPDEDFATPDAPLSSPTNYFEVEFDTPQSLLYTLWVRLRATDDARWNDSIWVQFSDGAVWPTDAPAYPIGSTDGLLVNLESCKRCGVAGWGFQNRAWWLNQSPVIELPAGHHTIRIQTREDGVQVDNIILSPSRFAVPFAASPGWARNTRMFY